ncbi:flagellar basal body P-ring formation protein FlgA [Chromohalobacter canadensis]|uniref:flagellar basal body P-ring formation chaperone FlgA n=1 Tax=Chromohalobacter canadensis TaxID=141389 RepID=UPI0021BF029A|nr:flagellar basal body P-ring formation chaperone FlgA [Chromohalobacter canadensis]MCT8469803.1 flagellar basal body P-ring formation protein FlgA [Chromohalobacter canadensis]MCT8472362.1 flagellar basal body P-ring formation protein FlgA [Chromohalobacter canadensis]MCT8499525.1 flagellar basal body P-ring formation protein FlgA [Chromohalobacter canadensis]
MQRILNATRAFSLARLLRLVMVGLVLGLLAIAATPAALATSDDAIAQATRHFLMSQAASLGDDVDVELKSDTSRLPECRSPQPFLPREGVPQGRVMVGIRCNNDERVRYVQATVSASVRFLVAATALKRGERLSADMLDWERADVSRRPRNALDDPSQAIGKVVTQRLAQGMALRSDRLRQPYLVHRGEPVTLIAGGEGFSVTREGEALNNGGKGDSVRARMPDGEVLQGQVDARGRLAVRY